MAVLHTLGWADVVTEALNRHARPQPKSSHAQSGAHTGNGGCPFCQGAVTIESRLEGEFVVIVISDTGTGIDPALLPRIFEPYFSTKSAAEGTGLGLPITKRIVEGHGGRLEVTSAVATGTTFTIRLPLEGKNLRLDEAIPYEL